MVAPTTATLRRGLQVCKDIRKQLFVSAHGCLSECLVCRGASCVPPDTRRVVERREPSHQTHDVSGGTVSRLSGCLSKFARTDCGYAVWWTREGLCS